MYGFSGDSYLQKHLKGIPDETIHAVHNVSLIQSKRILLVFLTPLKDEARIMIDRR
jgi:hypothetical protein